MDPNRRSKKTILSCIETGYKIFKMSLCLNVRYGLLVGFKNCYAFQHFQIQIEFLLIQGYHVWNPSLSEICF